MRNIIMLGVQGSGKGTQAKILAEKHGLPHISTGDIFREAIKNETELGLKAKELINAGKLVPDDIVTGIVRERIEKEDCVEGYILDGFPRNLEQAKALDVFADINYVIELKVPDDISVVGLDNVEVAAFHIPPLTTIRQFLPQLATMGVQMLLDILAGKEPSQPEIILEPALIVRQSTAPPRSD